MYIYIYRYICIHTYIYIHTFTHNIHTHTYTVIRFVIGCRLQVTCYLSHVAPCLAACCKLYALPRHDDACPVTQRVGTAQHGTSTTWLGAKKRHGHLQAFRLLGSRAEFIHPDIAIGGSMGPVHSHRRGAVRLSERGRMGSALMGSLQIS